jgi:hypothetical protein
MARFATLLTIAVLAGCQHLERPTYREPLPAPVKHPPPPPERILRRAPDFRFKDPETGKTYFYRGYAETLPGGGEFRHEVVTVLEATGDYERDATDEERAYALEVMVKDWHHKGLDEQIAYHAEMARIGRERRDSLIDSKIVFAEEAQKDLAEQVVALEADLRSSTRTSGYTPPPGRVEFLNQQLAQKKSELAELRAKLEALRYLRESRDRAYGRSSRPTGS